MGAPGGVIRGPAPRRLARTIGGLALAVCGLWPNAGAGQPAAPPPAPQAPVDAPAFKGPETTVTYRMVPVGERRKIGFFSSIFPDCTSQGPVVLRLIKKPEHGTITFEDATSFPYAVNPACAPKRVPGTWLIYEAAEGYEGLDKYGLLVMYPNGLAAEIDGRVSIR